MGKTKKHVKKRTITILVISGALVVTFFAWLIWRVASGSVYVPNSGNTIRTKTYTDTTNFYKLDYPAYMILTEAADCCEGSPKDWTKYSRSVSFRAPSYPEEHILTVQADQTRSLSDQITGTWRSSGHSPQDLRINDQPARYVRVVFESSYESYLDHQYLITAPSGGSVYMMFRERYRLNETSWDGSGNAPVFEAMVRSVILQ